MSRILTLVIILAAALSAQLPKPGGSSAAAGSGDVTQAGANVFTGSDDFSAATLFRVRTGSGAPASTACDVAGEVGSVYINNDTSASQKKLYVCIDTGSSTFAWIQWQDNVGLNSAHGNGTEVSRGTVGAETAIANGDSWVYSTDAGINRWTNRALKAVLRTHATDCTALTDGTDGQACWEKDSDRIFVCEPTAGGCDTAGEWILASASAPAFSAITSATNTTAAMVVGSGASLAPTGTGTITATQVPVSAGAAPTADGTLAYDSTAEVLKMGNSGTSYKIYETVCGAGIDCSPSGSTLTIAAATAVMLTQATAQNATPWQLASSGESATAYTATPTPNRCASAQPATGSFWEFTPDVNSGTAPTLACGSQAALNIQELISGTATNIVSGRLKAGIPYTLKKLASTWLVVPQEAVPATATALAANGANCSAGNYPLGVDASGAVEGCTAAGGSFDPTTTVELYSEFQGGVMGADTSGHHFAISAIGGATGEATAGSFMGAIKLISGTTSDDNAMAYQDFAGGFGTAQAYDGIVFDSYFKAKIDSTANIAFCVGYTSNNFDLNASDNAIGICYSTASSDTNYMCVTRSGGAATRTDTGVAADTNWHRFRIRATAAGTIKCSVDGTETAGQSTNVPTAALAIVANGRTKTTAAKTLWLDYVWTKITGLSR